MSQWSKGLGRVAAFVVGGLLLMMVASCGTTGPRQEGETVTVLAGSRSYNDRPEVETLFYGDLEPNQRDGEPPPNQRPGLYYRLASSDKTYEMYTDRIIPGLEALLGRSVMVEGKLLLPSGQDLLGEELYPATVRLMHPTSPQGQPNLLPCATTGKKLEDKLHPTLAEWLNTRQRWDTEDVIVTFCEYLELPLGADADEVRELRKPTFNMLTEELKRYGASVTNTYWLINGVSVEVKLENLLDIAARGDVQYQEPSEDGSSPP